MVTPRLGAPLIVDIGIDVNDVDTMASFWQAVMGYERTFERPGHVYLSDPQRAGPHIYLQQVPEPRVEKNRLHLDILVPSLAEAVARVQQLGATILHERRSIYTSFVVCADPEGNQFCLVDLVSWEETRPPWWTS